MKYWLTVALLAASCSCPAQPTCPPVPLRDFPARDLPSGTAAVAVAKGMASHNYYYGLGVARNYGMARLLAFAEMASDTSGPTDGAAVLLMLYANGYGVKKNIDLCQRLSCGNVGGAPFEIEGREQHLKAIADSAEAKPFDICDDITSGYMMGFCQSLISERRGYERDASWKRLLHKWPAKDVAASQQLRKAATACFNARAGFEVDLSGTGRAAFELQESDELEDHFLKLLAAADSCSLKPYNTAAFETADKDLNTVYKKIMVAKDADWGTVKKEDIKAAQRAWLQYCDAWVTFLATRCPQLNPTSIKTILTTERTTQLKDFLDTP